MPVEARVLETDLATCLARNAQRSTERRVPAEVVEDKWHAIAATTDAALHSEGITTIDRSGCFILR